MPVRPAPSLFSVPLVFDCDAAFDTAAGLTLVVAADWSASSETQPLVSVTAIRKRISVTPRSIGEFVMGEPADLQQYYQFCTIPYVAGV